MFLEGFFWRIDRRKSAQEPHSFAFSSFFCFRGGGRKEEIGRMEKKKAHHTRYTHGTTSPFPTQYSRKNPRLEGENYILLLKTDFFPCHTLFQPFLSQALSLVRLFRESFFIILECFRVASIAVPSLAPHLIQQQQSLFSPIFFFYNSI